MKIKLLRFIDLWWIRGGFFPDPFWYIRRALRQVLATSDLYFISPLPCSILIKIAPIRLIDSVWWQVRYMSIGTTLG